MKFFREINSISDVIKKAKEYQNQLLMGIGVLALIVGGTVGYLYYKKSQEEKAYRAFVVATEFFDAPVKPSDSKETDDLNLLGKKEFKTNKEKWEKVASVFKAGYEKHSGSGIASMFLIYHAQALVELGKKDEAKTTLKKAVLNLSDKKVANYFKSKLALMLLDSKNEKEVSQGLEMLSSIAGDETSVVHDAALYHLGEYYWYQKKFQESKNYWNQLLLKYGKSEKNPSSWANAAKDKLRLIDADVE